MGVRNQKDVLENLDLRLGRIEQILPTLATKEELREEGERTRRHVEAVVETAMGGEEERTRRHVDAVVETAMRDEGERTRRHMDAVVETAVREARRHFDVVAESMLDKITLVAEGHAVLNGNHDSLKHETRARFVNHDLRITRLEAKRPRR